MYAYAHAAQRDYDKAAQVLSDRQDTGVATAELEVDYNGMLFALDRGQWDKAAAAAEQGLAGAAKAEPLIAGAEWRNRSLTAAVLGEKETPSVMQARLLREIANIKAHAAQTDEVYDSYSEILLLSVGYLGARIDAMPVVEAVLADVAQSPDIDGSPLLVQMREVLLAERERLADEPLKAIDRLSALAKNDDALIPVHRALARAAKAAGNDDLALREAQWLTTRRGRAFVELGADDLQTPINVVDSTLVYLEAAELFLRKGDRKNSQASLARFLSIWPQERLTGSMRDRVSAIAN
jgi:hypothetical protein